MLLAAGALALGAGLTVAGAGLLLMGAAFPAVSSGALATVGALTALTALSLGLAAGMGASAVAVDVYKRQQELLAGWRKLGLEK